MRLHEESLKAEKDLVEKIIGSPNANPPQPVAPILQPPNRLLKMNHEEIFKEIQA
jgi:hypothetical protein